jgi:hypothetical protein
MTTARKLILASAGLIAVGVAGAVMAENIHVLNIRLPDGTQEQIRYLGDTAPKVSFAEAPRVAVAFSPFADPFFGPDSPFAAMDRISAQMDREAAQMMRQASTLPAGAGGMTVVDFGKLPPGVSGYSVVQTFSGGQVCTRSTQYTSNGDGRPPKILTSTSKGCDAAALAAPTTAATAAPAGAVSQVRYDGPKRAATNTD